MEKKKRAMDIWYDIENAEIMGKPKPSREEIKKLLWEIDHPLMKLDTEGYRLYYNTKEWNCHFCEKKIKAGEGYWGHKLMQWSQGVKLCHECFLKLLVLIEENRQLSDLFENYGFWIEEFVKSRERKSSKRKQLKINIGDKIRVKDGVTDPDYPDRSIGGWTGKVSDIERHLNEEVILIEWDDITLRKFITLDFIEQCEENKLEYRQMYLYPEDVEVTKKSEDNKTE